MSIERHLPPRSVVHRRAVVALLASGAIGTALPGCGGAPSSSAASRADKAQQAGLDFARCMRARGVTMADPKPGPGGGGPRIEISATPGTAGKVDRAQAACSHFLRGIDKPKPADQRKFLEAALKWSACMRRNGVSVPDPTPGQGGMVKIGPGVKANVDNPAFQRADAKCRSLLPGGGPSVQAHQGGGPGASMSPAP